LNDLLRFRDVFRGVEPWSGTPPRGFYADWTGALTSSSFRAYTGLDPSQVGGEFVQTRLPVIEDGEGWFEAVAQIESAREARGRYTMITLGACYGAQAVGSWCALQHVNPMPATLVAVEPEPVNLQWVAEHFRNNGLDPDDHWLIGSAISDTNDPVLFPVGSPGSGAQNCIVTNEMRARKIYARRLTTSGARARKAVRDILLTNTMGLERNLLTGEETDVDRDVIGSIRQWVWQKAYRARAKLRQQPTERDQGTLSDEFDFNGIIKLLSAVTLKDVLGPFEKVDYLEVDIQQSEGIVFPPFMDLLKRKVCRVHIGTHGADTHKTLATLFHQSGWEMVFDYPPNARYQTDLGSFALNDGVLSVLNPAFSPVSS
jgi:hypothetical protein